MAGHHQHRTKLRRRVISALRRPFNRRMCGDEEGSASAELVIATPFLLLLILAIVQFALWEHATHVATAAAQQGLAAGRVEGGSAAVGQNQAQVVLDQLGRSVLVGPDIAASRSAVTTTVTVTGHAEGVLPFVSLPVHATATGSTERYTAAGQSP